MRESESRAREFRVRGDNDHCLAESAVGGGINEGDNTTVSAASATSSSLRKNEEVVLNGNAVPSSAAAEFPEFQGLM